MGEGTSKGRPVWNIMHTQGANANSHQRGAGGRSNEPSAIAGGFLVQWVWVPESGGVAACIGQWPLAHIGQPAIACVLSAPVCAGIIMSWDMAGICPCIGQGHLCAAPVSDGVIAIPAMSCEAPACIIGHPAAIGVGEADWETGWAQPARRNTSGRTNDRMA